MERNQPKAAAAYQRNAAPFDGTTTYGVSEGGSPMCPLHTNCMRGRPLVACMLKAL